MDNINKSKIVYSILNEDIQNEAIEFLGRNLSGDELKAVEDKLRDILEWDFYVREAIKQMIEDFED